MSCSGGTAYHDLLLTNADVLIAQALNLQESAGRFKSCMAGCATVSLFFFQTKNEALSMHCCCVLDGKATMFNYHLSDETSCKLKDLTASLPLAMLPSTYLVSRPSKSLLQVLNLAKTFLYIHKSNYRRVIASTTASPRLWNFDTLKNPQQFISFKFH